VNHPRICVGVDGSPVSQSALRWAAIEAAGHNAELVIIHAYEWRVAGAATQIGGALADVPKTIAEELVSSAVATARSAAPGVNVRGEAVLGAPGPALVAASGRFDLTVLGNRGRGGFASLLLGSVSQHVATHATSPVVVVRGRPDIADGPIIVGVDGSPPSDHAVRVAFEEADARRVGVLAVRVYTSSSAALGVDGPVDMEEPVQRRDNELRRLTEDIAPWREKYPDVAVKSVAVAGHTAEVLIGLSSSAQLVVVGTRGHGGFAGLLLGSVGLQLLHHCDCPVLIARSTETP
jgi:nucleotide-binding universal stress UspA family protein